MFIKKDRRKINEILKEEGEKITTLKLSKRTAEFQGSVRALCHETKIKVLVNLRTLNLYDNALTNLNGIGLLAQTQIEEINLGCNKLSSLPLEFGNLITLKQLWLDDNEFDTFPICVCQLKHLEVLRISGNSIKTIPSLISSLHNLETLAADNNELMEFPVGCRSLPRLKNLWLRQNRLTSIPNSLDTGMFALEVLSLSSNQLTVLPDAISHLPSLRFLYLNGNALTNVPESLCLQGTLQEVNLSNNEIHELPEQWEFFWGLPDPDTGLLTGKGPKGPSALTAAANQETAAAVTETARVSVLGNPLMSRIATMVANDDVPGSSIDGLESQRAT